MRRLSISLLILVSLLATSGSVAGAQGGTNGRSFRIGARDVLKITVDEIPNLPAEYTVDGDGNVFLEAVGKIQASGLTEGELEGRIKERMQQQGVRKATVKVTISAFRSRPVLVLGAVVTPGNQTPVGSARLMEVLLSAGGLTGDHGPNVQVRRQADNGLSDQVTIQVAQLIETLDPDVNIPIFAGDVINVAAARAITVSMLGAVKNVGALSFKNTERVTLLTAIARAGGLTETASKKIAVKRQDPKTGKLDEQLVDYRRILDGKDPDLELLDGDLVVVKESFF